MPISQRGSGWQADIRNSRTGQRHRVLCPSKQEAAAWEANALLAIEQDKPLPPSPAIIRKNPHMKALDTIQGLFDYVDRTDWVKRRAAQTLIKNGLDVVAYFQPKTTVSSITAADISNFKFYLAEHKLAKPATINRKLSALSKLLKTAYELGIIDRLPPIKWEKEQKTKFRYLNEDEIARFLAYWAENRGSYYSDMYRACQFLLETGARLSEAASLELKDLAEDWSHVTFWKTKTDKPRTIPLTKEYSAELERSWTPFLSYVTRPFSCVKYPIFRKNWRKMQEVLDWPDVTPHTLRHTCCTRLIQAGVDIKRVMEWMGHSSINTTSRYMQISPQGLSDVVHLLDKSRNKS